MNPTTDGIPLRRSPWAAVRRRLWTWSRSAFLVNLLLVASIVATALGAAALAFHHFAQLPRAEWLGNLFAAQITSVSSVIKSLPPEQADRFLAQLEVHSGGTLSVDQPAAWPIGDPPQELAQQFMATLRRRLPDHGIAFSPGAHPQLWARVDRPGAAPVWLRLPVGPYTNVPTALWIAGLLAFLALAVGSTAVLLKLYSRNLEPLGDALDQLGSAGHGAPALAPLDMPDFADLSLRFQEMSQRLARIDADRELMLASVSHDLRSLLTRLRMTLEPDAGGEAPPDAVRYITEINRLIGQFMDFARSDRAADSVALDLNDLVRELAAEFEVEGMEVELSLQALPAAHLDPLAIRRMLANLLDNALRHGGGRARLNTALVDASGLRPEIRLEVIDEGPGVALADLGELTRPFFRTPNARARCPGSGLGLSIASRIALAHGGLLTPRLNEGGGLRIEVRLPTVAP